MMLDIRALQHMYGADFGHNGGNTTYSWDPLNGSSFVNGQLAIDPGGNRIFQTIWDGNGTDSYDLSNYATNLVIDLAPGGHSTFSDAQRAFLGGGPNGGYARGNVFNALQVGGDARSLIENAVGGSGHDAITGNAAANTLSGSAGNDTLSGAGGVDTLHGGAGDDRLDGGLYADASFGGDGNDSFLVTGGDVADHVDGGAGIDTLDVSGHTATTLGFSINLQTGSYDFVPTAFGPFSVVGVENVLGSARADTIVGANLANRLEGNAGNDVLQGNGGNDTLQGGEGNDTLQGGEGNDVVEGGGGSDDERGGNGDDRFVFNVGFGYPNSVTGGAGRDTFDFRGIGGGYSGAAIVIDLVAGYSDVDGTMRLAELENVLGSDSAETIRGSGAANQLLGFGGNDTIVGGSGNDTLNGGSGNDRLTGGAGRDVLTGGAGADRFVFTAAANSPNNAATCDRLVAGGGGSAFDLPGAGNGDRIDLSALPGTLAWSDIRLQNVGGNTVCLIDVGGSAAADMRIQINDGAVGAGAYGAADFLL
jgi:serralysin